MALADQLAKGAPIRRQAADGARRVLTESKPGEAYNEEADHQIVR